MNAPVDAVAILPSCQQIILPANWLVSEMSVMLMGCSGLKPFTAKFFTVIDDFLGHRSLLAVSMSSKELVTF